MNAFKYLISLMTPTRFAIMYSLFGSGFGLLNSLIHVYFLGLSGVANYFLLNQIAILTYLAVDERYVNTTWLKGLYVRNSVGGIFLALSLNYLFLGSIALFQYFSYRQGLSINCEDVVLSGVLCLVAIFQNRLDSFFKSTSNAYGYTKIRFFRVVSFFVVSFSYVIFGWLFSGYVYLILCAISNFFVVFLFYLSISGKVYNYRPFVDVVSGIFFNALSGLIFYYLTRIWVASYIDEKIYSLLNFAWRGAGPVQHILMRFRYGLSKLIPFFQMIAILSVLSVSLTLIFIDNVDGMVFWGWFILVVAFDRSIQSLSRSYYMSETGRVLYGERRYLLFLSFVVFFLITYNSVNAASVVIIAASLRGALSLYRLKAENVLVQTNSEK